MVTPAQNGERRTQKSDAAKADAAADVIRQLTPAIEPPPMSRPLLSPPYAYPIPFGEPPAEPIELVDGEIPWELRDGE